jgi:transposase
MTAKAVGIRRQAGRGAYGHRAEDRVRGAVGVDRAAVAEEAAALSLPGRKRLPDRQALQGILFVLHTGVAWQHLPAERLRLGRDMLASPRRVAATSPS